MLKIALVLAVHLAAAGLAQSPSSAPAPDSAALLDRARDAQRRFERLRRDALPRTADQGFGPCDEVIGRMCLTYGQPGGGDWEPEPEPPGILRARQELLDVLSEVALEIPGDRWVLAQRVYYLGEDGRWGRALSLVGRCGPSDPWWCHALRGLALHGQDRYGESLDAFRTALDAMGEERAGAWRDPEEILDDRAHDVWTDAEDGEREALRERLWVLSDPLLLVPGNDRLTAHFARRTVSWIREDAENAYGISWGWDLEQLVVRYGSELGWERTRPSAASLAQAAVVGHHHPESRQYVPPGEVFADPTGVRAEGWSLESERPRSAYAPTYAPRMAALPFQVARFRRGDTLLVAAGFTLPDSAPTRLPPAASGASAPAAGRASPVPSPVSPGLPAGPPQAGLVLLGSDGSRVAQALVRGRSSGAAMVRAPSGRYLASVEVWSPADARAARGRQGISMTPLPPDVAAVSDLVLLRWSPEVPTTLEEAVPRIEPLARVCRGGATIVAWELYGLGLRREPIGFRLRLVRSERGFFRRAGEFFGLVDRDEAVSLEWTEAGPERLRPHFRAVELRLPDEAEPGGHVLHLAVDLAGRESLEVERVVEVLPDSDCTG